MSLNLAFHFTPEDRALVIGFGPEGGAVTCPADVEYFAATMEARCQLLKQRVHLFFDLTHLNVAADLVGPFNVAKRSLCDRFALTVWHCGPARRAGDDAQRVHPPGEEAQPVPHPRRRPGRLPQGAAARHALMGREAPIAAAPW